MYPPQFHFCGIQMELFNEKQSTQRATMRSIEVNYVNTDAKDFDTTGVYQFALPARWTSHSSMNKAIGLRRLRYTPWWGCIGFKVSLYSSNDADAVAVATHTTELMQFTSDNTLQECFVKIAEEASWTTTVATYSCIINYDNQNITMCFIDELGASYGFKLTFDNNSHQYAENLLMLFNQPVTDDSKTWVASRINTNTWMSFTNVWNRHDLYFHASFSDSTRQIIGVNNDFWTQPSVFYDGSRTSDDFIIRFTDDTVTEVTPRHGVLLIQFSLIYNHQKYID